MKATILVFKQKCVTVSVVCNTCETVWIAQIQERIYNTQKTNKSKCICPFCGDVDVGVALME